MSQKSKIIHQNYGKVKRAILFIACIVGVPFFAACSRAEERDSSVPEKDTSDIQVSQGESTGGQQEEVSEEDRDREMERKVNVQIGTENFTATLENNEAANAFAEMMREEPVVIQMSDYSGFEKVGSLGRNLPASNSQMTTQAGDIVLYNGSQIVIFYGSNSWSYTRLARIDDLTGWEEALGNGDVTAVFSIGE